MREKLEFWIVKFLINLTKILPKSFIYILFKFLALLLFYIDKKRQKLTINNLKNLYPNKSESELKSIAKEVFINISKTLSESILIYNNKFSKDDILNAIINPNELEKIYRYKKDNRGIIFIAGHFGNWELLPQFFAINGIKIHGVGREGNNKLIEESITTPLREKFGNRNIYKKGAGIAIARALKNGENVGLLIDQKAGLKNGILTKFFDKDATTTNLIANLKLKFDPFVLPVFLVRVENSKFKLIIKEPIEYIASEVEAKEERVLKMTQKYNDVIEEVIREYPLQWFWMHNRWKL